MADVVYGIIEEAENEALETEYFGEDVGDKGAGGGRDGGSRGSRSRGSRRKKFDWKSRDGGSIGNLGSEMVGMDGVNGEEYSGTGLGSMVVSERPLMRKFGTISESGGDKGLKYKSSFFEQKKLRKSHSNVGDEQSNSSTVVVKSREKFKSTFPGGSPEMSQVIDEKSESGEKDPMARFMRVNSVNNEKMERMVHNLNNV
jgi:hypothetical protein